MILLAPFLLVGVSSKLLSSLWQRSLLTPAGSEPSVFCSPSERRVDSNDRVYFVNHNTKTTQWEDPRTQG